MLSVFGTTGFIGSRFCRLYRNNVIEEERGSTIPSCSNSLYLRGTTSNYNVFEDPSKDVRDNILLLTDTLKNLKSGHCFNLVSSWFVYGFNGKSQKEPMHESDFCRPNGFYSISKFAQEMFLQSYCETFDVKYRILRMSNIIGGDKNASSRKNALEFILSDIKQGKDISIYEGDNFRNFLHVDDACRAIKLVLDTGKINEIFNIGSLKSERMIDIANFAKQISRSKSRISIIPQPSFHKNVQVVDFKMDTSKIQSLGFCPEYKDVYSIIEEYFS